MNNSDYEMFCNWNSSLASNENIQTRTILAEARKMIVKSFTIPEIEEVLLASGYRQNLIKTALDSMNESDGLMTENIEAESENEESFGVPKKYSDMAPRFEKILKTSGAKKFVDLMTSGTNPLIKISKKEKETFHRIASLAIENPVHLNTLHSYIRPSITSELAENVCKARKIRSKCNVEGENSSYKIVHNGNTIKVSTSPVSSTHTKFAESNYGVFGFPDEYVIMAYEEDAPYARLTKDLNV